MNLTIPFIVLAIMFVAVVIGWSETWKKKEHYRCRVFDLTDGKEAGDNFRVNPRRHCALHIAESGDGLKVRHNPSITIKLQETMKKIKMKDTILSHYQKVHELEMDGFAVRVFKPRTMQQLPAHDMLSWIKYRAEDAIRYMIIEQRADWQLGNPDYALWDALTVYHYDPSHKAFNIYIAAILVRPFSREAIETYRRMHESIDDVNQRLMLMWDSREFDRIGGNDQSYGAYKNQDEADAVMYCVANKESDIRDTSPSCYLQVVDNDEYSPVQRCGVTLRQMPDGGTEYYAINNGHEEMERGGTELMHAAAKCYTDFRKEHPEVTEMRFYTDELVEINDDDEEAGE